jgi:hypothetical protein
MNAQQAIQFIKKNGVVLASAKGSVPNLADTIANEKIKGSWWGHPKSHQIFFILEAVADSDQILVCRLIKGKRTFVHCRLWPALVRASKHLNKKQMSQISEQHTASGRHVIHEIPFPKWVPADVMMQAKKLTEREALAILANAKIAVESND